LAIIAKPPASRDRDFCDDIRASSRSAPSNIAEGFGRTTHRDFAHFLSIAHGSLQETRNHLRDAFESGYISQDTFQRVGALARRAAAATNALHGYLLRTPSRRRPAPRERRTS
jgi:four helix bundle protein